MIFGGFEKCTLIDYPGKISCMVFTIGCNFRCPYCHNPELVDETIERKYTEQEIFDFLKRRKIIIEGVVVTGGEPTMHTGLPAFLRKVKKMGFLVKLDSNGTNPKMLTKIIKERLVDYIAMDIKSPLTKYNAVVSRPTDIKKIRQSIDIIMNSEVAYEFRTTVIKSLLSPEDILEIGKEIHGAKKYYLQKFVSTKILNPQFKRKTTYTDEEFEQFQELLLDNVQHCEIR